MLRLPATGTAPSVKTHNCKCDVHVDWIEASLLFATKTVTRSDIVDALREENVYESQDFASDWVSTLWGELDRRVSLLGAGTAIKRSGDRAERVMEWMDRPALSFCITLAMLQHYRTEVVEKCGNSYVEQGELFERLSQESLALQRWKVERVGWSKSKAMEIDSKVQALAEAIGDPVIPNGVSNWAAPSAKDGGLDLVAWWPFKDGWGGRPVLLVQCASGENWRDKILTPNLDLWSKLVDFSVKPRRGLTMPFAIEEDEFRRQVNNGQVFLLLDRHRLLQPLYDDGPELPTKALATDLLAWIAPRVAAFPRNNV
jgi:hypothetical protein